MTHSLQICMVLTSVVCSQMSSIADPAYTVSLTTNPLIGDSAGPFSVAFQLIDGSGAGDGNNTVILSGFHFGATGDATGTPILIGGASGSLLSGGCPNGQQLLESLRAALLARRFA